MISENTVAISSRARQWLLFISALIIADGLAIIALPALVSRVHPNVFAGWALLVAGSLHLAFAWWFRTLASAVWQALLAAAAAAIGLYLIGRQGWPVDELRTAVAAWLLVDGLIECCVYARTRTSHRRAALFVDGITTLIFSVAVWLAWPSGDPRVVAAFIGLNVALSGATRLLVSLALPQTASGAT
jgi:uncharacterized membrane protein HdeD (DUF308 family)